MWTYLETSLGVISRVHQFVDDTPKEFEGNTPPSLLELKWPQSGQIEFRDVFIRHPYVTVLALVS